MVMELGQVAGAEGGRPVGLGAYGGLKMVVRVVGVVAGYEYF